MNAIEKLRTAIASWREPLPTGGGDSCEYCTYRRDWDDGNNVGRENCANEAEAILKLLEAEILAVVAARYEKPASLPQKSRCECTTENRVEVKDYYKDYYVTKYQVELVLLWLHGGLSGEPPPISTIAAAQTIQALAERLLAQLHGESYIGPMWNIERADAINLLYELGWLPEDK